MKTIRLAILSATGTARKRTLPAVTAEALCEVVGVHGRDQGRLAKLADQFSVPHFSSDAADLLDRSKPDFVLIGSPPMLHAEQIQLCLDRKIPILCEKPLCLATNVAVELRRKVIGSGVPFRLAHHLRHQPGVAALRRLLLEGNLGRLRGGSLQWGFWMNEAASNASWKMKPEEGGPNAFYDAGIHVVDLALHLLPAPVAVSAMVGNSRFPRTLDHVAALLHCGGATMEITASQSVRNPCNDLVLDFENGTVRIPAAFGELSFRKMHITTSQGTRIEEFPETNLYAAEVRDFIGLMEGKASAGTTIDEAVRGIQVLDALTESYKRKAVVNLVE